MENVTLNSKSVLEANSKISLKRFCEELGLCYQYVLKASKQPEANVPYDPKATNYAAIDRIIAKKEIDLASIDWEAVSESIADFVPVNKPEDFQVGVAFRIREPKTTEDTILYTVQLTTETHIVFMDIKGTQPRVMNWDTFLHQSPRIIG